MSVPSLMNVRGTLFDDLLGGQKIWLERVGSSPSIVELVLDCMNNRWEDHAAKHLWSIPALDAFAWSVGRGGSNETEFGALVSAFASALNDGEDTSYPLWRRHEHNANSAASAREEPICTYEAPQTIY
ncbi:MAG: hypothetical protein M1839_006355 [Geoglossum umbratile]|nr:MAG: hypothetical protein M1839_006355 [Geoglossum umbratile]